MQISPYLHFDGDCAEAFKFYADLLGGEIEMTMKFGESPMTGDVPDNWQDKVMHVQMKAADGFALMGTDAPPAYFKTPQGFSVSLTITNLPRPSASTRRWRTRHEAVSMELQKTFWAERFAMLTDRFGIPWIVNCPPQG